MSWLLLALWTFAVGAIVGSFLNVVAYRLPRGMSIVWPGSHCPNCKTPICWYDNIPVVSWFLLGGKCRHCSQSISPRYPLVETLSGTLFVAVSLLELVNDRAGLWSPAVLPGDEHFGRQGAALGFAVLLISDWAVFGTLLAAALVEYDGGRPPRRLFLPGLAMAAGTSVLLPALRWPVAHALLDNPWNWPAGLVPHGLRGWDSRWLAAYFSLAGAVAGIAAGAIGAAACSWFQPQAGGTGKQTAGQQRCRRSWPCNAVHRAGGMPNEPLGLTGYYWLAAGCLGAQLGPKAACLVGGSAVLAMCISRRIGLPAPPSAWLLIGAAAWIASGLL